MALKSRLGFGMMRLPVKNGDPAVMGAFAGHFQSRRCIAGANRGKMSRVCKWGAWKS